jgi:hypothetical protein
MPLRRLWHVVSGKFGAENVGASDTDRHREQRTDHLDPVPRAPPSAASIPLAMPTSRVHMKWRIALGHQHGKTPKKNFAVPQTRDHRGKIWPGLGRNRGIPFAIYYQS